MCEHACVCGGGRDLRTNHIQHDPFYSKSGMQLSISHLHTHSSLRLDHLKFMILLFRGVPVDVVYAGNNVILEVPRQT